MCLCGSGHCSNTYRASFFHFSFLEPRIERPGFAEDEKPNRTVAYSLKVNRAKALGCRHSQDRALHKEEIMETKISSTEIIIFHH